MRCTACLIAALVATAATAQETVLGVYIFSRHGDRTAKSTPPANLTDLGYQEVFTSGTYFRNRYISSIEGIDEKLNAVVGRTVTEAQPNAPELRLIEEERLSTQRCLQICERLSQHIAQIQLSPDLSSRSPEATEHDTFSERVTKEGLEACKESLTLTTTRLETHMKELTHRLIKKSKAIVTSEDEVADLARLEEQWEAARQCIEICSKAENHLKENVSTIDNYGTGDAVQFMVSTDGKVIHGKNRGMGWRTRQVGGHLSDAAVMQLSRDMSMTSLRSTRRDGYPSRSNTPPELEDNVESGQASDFKVRHGRGVRLAPEVSSDSIKSSTRPSVGERYDVPKC